MDPLVENKQYDSYFIDVFRTWITCREMVTDRGYTIPLTFMKAENNDFYTLYQNIDAPAGFNNYDILGTKGDKRILLKFTLDKDVVNRQDIITFRNSVNETYGENTDVVYVVKTKPNTFVYKEIKENDEIFLMSELVFNRTKHRLVPKHVLMSEVEKKDVLSTYDCRDTQIPRMVTTDYLARYFGAKAGDMFKIYRPSPSSGVYITYRVVK
jgi:DNA-directed RNA polymerase I, II, and III subunit RPABC1